MKLILVFLSVTAVAIAAPQRREPRQNLDQYYNLDEIFRTLASGGFPVPPPEVQVVRYNYIPPSATGEYQYSYVLSDGTQVREESSLRDDGVLVRKGAYAYLLNQNQQQRISYTADDNGFQPEVIVEPPGSIDPSAAASAIFG